MRQQRLEGSIIIVAKCPVPGQCKTRLIPLLGQEGAALLARAMLSDILVTLSTCQPLDSVQKILLYAPPTERGREMMQQILHEELHLAVDSWTLMPMLQQDDDDSDNDLQSSDLGAKLADALIRARHLQQQQQQRQHGDDDCSSLFPVVFLGMDSPEIPIDEICAALSPNSTSTAVLCPASDGGYGMLSIPANVQHAIFSNMIWSHSLTAICQIKALTDSTAGISSIRIGKLMHDIDEPNDVVALARRLLEQEETTDVQQQQQQQQQQQHTNSVLDRPSSAAAALGFDFTISMSSSSCTYTKKALERLGQLTISNNSNSSSSNDTAQCAASCSTVNTNNNNTYSSSNDTAQCAASCSTVNTNNNNT